MYKFHKMFKKNEIRIEYYINLWDYTNECLV